LQEFRTSCGLAEGASSSLGQSQRALKLKLAVSSLISFAAICGALVGCARTTFPAAAGVAVSMSTALSTTQEEPTLRVATVIDEKSEQAPSTLPEVAGLRRMSVGTGFYITPHRVLTNHHVVDGCKAVTVGNNREGTMVSAQVIAQESVVDLAVVWTDAEDPDPAQFTSKIDEESLKGAAIVGYPEHGLPVLEAEVDPVSFSRAESVAGRGLYAFTGSVRRGNSGGPVLDGSGAVIGVVTAKINTVAVYQRTGEVVADLGYAIANATVLDFLLANRIEVTSVKVEERLSPAEILQEAHNFVRQVTCWK
jgi:S1-C subfamily serine protease